MNRILIVIASILLSLNARAQKTINDPMVALRTVKSFQAINVSGGIDLFLSYGNEAVAVSAKEAEIRDHIKTEVTDGVLKIWYEWKDKGSMLINNKQLRAYASYKTLQSLSGSGGSDILVDGTINGNTLSISLSGGSDFKGKVQVKTLSVAASGGSDVEVEGVASTIEVHASGGSDFNGFNLVAGTATLQASGGSDIEVTVNGTLAASASGGSGIRYKGTANANETKSSGASSIKKVSR